MDVYEWLKVIIFIVAAVGAGTFVTLAIRNKGKTISILFGFISVPLLFWTGYYIRSLISGGGTQHQLFVRGGILVTVTTITALGIYCLSQAIKKRR